MTSLSRGPLLAGLVAVLVLGLLASCAPPRPPAPPRPVSACGPSDLVLEVERELEQERQAAEWLRQIEERVRAREERRRAKEQIRECLKGETTR